MSLMTPLARRGWLMVAAALVCALWPGQAAGQAAGVELRAGIRAETVDGDLQAAIGIYEKVARMPDRAMAAEALTRMGRCQEKLGDNAAALKTYTRLASQFADQTGAAAQARQRAARLSKVAPGPADTLPATVGWYGGDWQSGVPGLAIWFRSEAEFVRIYDSFVVPSPGWTVLGVFTSVRGASANVQKAAWEIRSGMSTGSYGKLTASGVSAAVQTVIAGNGAFGPGAYTGYRFQVNGLRVSLPPGRYWLSVSPVVPENAERLYLSATLGRNAVGVAPERGLAYFAGPGAGYPVPVSEVAGRGQMGVAETFSQGVIIRAQGK